MLENELDKIPTPTPSPSAGAAEGSPLPLPSPFAATQAPLPGRHNLDDTRLVLDGALV